MKRPHAPASDAAPATPRHRRHLSEEERALWDTVARSTKPLKARQRKPKPHAAPVVTPSEPAAPPRPVAKPSRSEPVPQPRAKTLPPLVQLGRRERSQLSRGKKEIDARLDLHGMTQARAHRALLSFLHRASDEGLTFVLVITGKGRSNGLETERGVLRRQVPEWLSHPDFRACVVGFEEAHIGHGGGGALYIRIRRRGLR
jgi:DNA-nicking Smr family endonuclease